jgi:hypothetical protein
VGKGGKMKVKPLFKPNEHIDIYSYLKKKGIDNVEEYLQPSMDNEEPPELYENIEEGYNALMDVVKNILENPEKSVDKEK